MKKVLLGGLVAILVTLFGLAILVVAESSEDNLKKAGQQALAEREAILIEKKTDIQVFILQAATDRVVTKDEMVTLRNKIGDFERIKKEADEYLKFYGLKTSTVLDEELKKATNNYFKRHGVFKKDFRGEAKRVFVKATGQDVLIDRGIVIVDFTTLFLMATAVFSLCIAIVSARLPRGILGTVLFLTIFIVLILMILFL